MVASCAVPGCGNDFGCKQNLRFHGFPLSDVPRVQQWIKAICRVNWYPSKHSKICSDHFGLNDYTSEYRLKPTAVPSCSMPLPLHCFHGEEITTNAIHLVPLVQSTFYRDPLLELNVVREETIKQEEATCSQEEEQETACSQEIVWDKSVHKISEPILTRTERNLIELKKKYKSIQRKAQRQSKKITNMNNTIDELQKKIKDERNAFNLFEAIDGKVSRGMAELLRDEVTLHLQNSHRFSDHRKKFALTLFQYSPEAYEFLSDYVTLPAYRTLTHWVSPSKKKPTEHQNQNTSEEQNPIVCEDQNENSQEQIQIVCEDEDGSSSDVPYQIICLDENEVVCEDESL